MNQMPAQPKLYHITHLDNLPSIVADGKLWSDAAMIPQGGPLATIGMNSIKQRRLRLPVGIRATTLGNMSPSISAHVPSCSICSSGNHPELNYTGGQAPILHLEADLDAVVQWPGERVIGGHSLCPMPGYALYGISFTSGSIWAKINWSSSSCQRFFATMRSRKASSRSFWFATSSHGSWCSASVSIQPPSINRWRKFFVTFPRPPRVEIRRDWYY